MLSFAESNNLTDLEDKFTDLIFRTSQSIVTIESIRFINNHSQNDNNIGDMTRQLVSSGIVYDSSGNIIAAATSVVDSDRLYVHFNNNILPAHLVGLDYYTGLALIHIEQPVGTPVNIGHWQGCAGQLIVALGNSFGVRASPTIGFCAGSRPDGTMQFSARITSGTIGGGVFDLSGNLIGVVTGGIGHKQHAEAGIAVPASKVPGVVEYIRTYGDRLAGYVGISTVDIEISPAITVSFANHMSSSSLPRENVIDHGILITNVVDLSPAANVGLLKGDLLFSLNGSLIRSAMDLRNFVRQSKPGSLIEVGFLRNQTPYVVPIQVGQMKLTPSDSFQAPGESDNTSNSISRDSLLTEITQLKQMLQRLEQRLQHLR